MSNPKTEMKKGVPVWKPANVDDVFDKEDGFRYRKLHNDPTNLVKKQAEGWEIISDISGSKTTVEGGYGRINEGKPLTSVREHRDYILARMPEEMAKSRDEYMNNKAARQMSSLKRQASKDLGEIGGTAHGSISVEKKGVRTIIRD